MVVANAVSTVKSDRVIADRRRSSEEICSCFAPPFFLNAAATAVAAARVTLQVGEEPEQPPLHPVKEAPLLFGVAVSVTSVPLTYASEQSEPQRIPAGVLVTVPGPEVATVSVYVATLTRLKLAPTVTDVLPPTVQARVPEQPALLQPVNVEPVSGVAASVTEVPGG